MNTNFTDFEDRLIAQAEDAESTEYRRWCLLCLMFVDCLKQGGYVPDNVHFNFFPDLYDSFSMHYPFDFCWLENNGVLCLHIFDRNAFERDGETVDSSQSQEFMVPVSNFIKNCAQGHSEPYAKDKDTPIPEVIFDMAHENASELKGLDVCIWTLHAVDAPGSFHGQAGNLTYCIHWNSLESLWNPYMQIPDSEAIRKQLDEQLEKERTVPDTPAEVPQSGTVIEDEFSKYRAETPEEQVRSGAAQTPTDSEAEIERYWSETQNSEAVTGSASAEAKPTVSGSSADEAFSSVRSEPVAEAVSSENISQISAGEDDSGSVRSREDFIAEIKRLVQISQSELPQSVILNYLSRILTDAGRYDEIEDCNGFRKSRDGLALDGYAYDDTNNVLSLFYLDGQLSDLDEPMTTKEFDGICNKLENFFVKAATNELIRTQKVEPGCAEGGVAIRIHEKFRQDPEQPYSRVEFVVLTLRKRGQRFQSYDHSITPIEGGKSIPCQKSLLDLNTLYTLASSGENLIVDFTRPNFLGVPLYLIKTVNSGEYKSYVGAMPAQCLANIYSEYGQRVLSANVRAFLQLTNSVNKGIIATVKDEPEKFFAYNNGICLVATSVAEEEHGKVTIIKSAKDLQIVNGGQTTATLYYAMRDKSLPLDKINVPLKLSVISESVNAQDRSEFIRKISEYANTQSKVTASDLGSNTAFQMKFEQISRQGSCAIPTHSMPSYWYYERSRGSYREAFRAAGKNSDFSRAYAKENSFGKPDLAKWCKSWAQAPHVVSEGAQKCFTKFSVDLCKIEETDPKWERLTAETFKDSVAKGILFRYIDKLILHSEWYKQNRSYKANLVTYAMALFAKTIEDQFGKGMTLNFPLIWKEQTVPAWMDPVLEEFAWAAREAFEDSNRSHSDIGEWVKKEGCWNLLKKRRFTLNWSEQKVQQWITNQDNSILKAPAQTSSEA